MLLNNEELKFLEEDKEEGKLTEIEINEKYQRGEMRIVTEQGRYPLKNIKSILSSDIKLNPEYQRRRVWSNIQKSKLIESFIMNIPVPPVFLYEIDFSKYEVMDGLQRLSTLYDFYDDRFKLTGLELWSELNGMKYSELPEKIQKGIDRRYISTIVILNETAKSKSEEHILKKFVFERLNTGGTRLTEQETRNALYDGKMNQLCIKIAKENNTLHNLWKIRPFVDDITDSIDEEVNEEQDRDKKIYVRMEDVELVLRFFAYRQLEEIPATKLKDVLDIYIKQANEYYSDQLIDELEDLFNKTIDLVDCIYGDKAFLMYTKRKNGNFQWYPKPSKLVYDPILGVLYEYAYDNHKKIKLISKKEEIIKRTEELFITNSSDFNGRNNNKSDVIRRKELFRNIFENILGEE
ncbi:DUF262 domain-containing protein [Clostridium gasigenes]|uniref:GmrSD restriction endonucleases N-terminal domain-containing protein n=1 Tax=Clostridium gasigenes TaxID=94869 RepID=A0A1H0VGX3_9CLOT|nr:DUF262 domain-containing protein [Clostridium gasigenes]SDP77455.1 Protein of unknown function DUF262 [Clostridium gasigenes]